MASPALGCSALRSVLLLSALVCMLFLPLSFVPFHASPAPRRISRPARDPHSDAVASVLDQVSHLNPEDLERLVEDLLPTLLSKRRLLRDRARPKRIILVRHGESEGNKDRSAYAQTPDSQIQLTRLGKLQGEAAGTQIRKLVGNDSVRFFYSPYMRTRQTLHCILKAFVGQEVEMTAEPRLREQDFGNFQDVERMAQVYKERQQFGRFYYRFPNGEAGTDVFDRVSDFWSSLLRSIDASPIENLVLVSHGLLMRVFCMVYFHWTVEEFEQVWNPSNCEVWALEKVPGRGSYNLAGRWRPSPTGGTFREIRFGAKKNEPLWTHMKCRRGPRVFVVPSHDEPLDDPMFAELPGNRRQKFVKSEPQVEVAEEEEAQECFLEGSCEGAD